MLLAGAMSLCSLVSFAIMDEGEVLPLMTWLSHAVNFFGLALVFQEIISLVLYRRSRTYATTTELQHSVSVTDPLDL